jgi:hypothetical protein
MEFKRCVGHKGHHACDYPDNMVPVSKFNRYTDSSDGLQPMCSICTTYYNKYVNNAKISAAIKFVGGRDKLRAMTKGERTKIYGIIDTVKWKINDKVVSETKRFKFDDEIAYSTQKEQVKRKRDTKVGAYIRSVYDSCSVVGCDYPDYEVAHIHALKHGADDLPENCLALCPNHHRDLDRGRMTPLRQLDVGGYIYFGEQGIKLKHKVDSKYLDQCNLELEEWKNGTNKVQSENDRPSLAVG